MGQLRLLVRRHMAVIAFLILAAGNAAAWASLQAEQDARHNQLDVDEALRCVDRWETRAQARDAIETGARIPAEALTEVVASVSDDELSLLLERYGQLVDDGVADAREQLEDPDCDIDTARDRLNR